MKRTDRNLMEATVAERQGSGREAVAERSRRQKTDRRSTNWRRGRTWATSVLANAKSKIHSDTSSIARRHGVKVQVLTRGDLARESGGEVSRGRSSVESPRKRAGAKGRRNHGGALQSIVRRGKPGPNVSRSRPQSQTLREPWPPERCPAVSGQGSDTRAHA
jgi:hypothetical protein